MLRIFLKKRGLFLSKGEKLLPTTGLVMKILYAMQRVFSQKCGAIHHQHKNVLGDDIKKLFFFFNVVSVVCSTGEDETCRTI